MTMKWTAFFAVALLCAVLFPVVMFGFALGFATAAVLSLSPGSKPLVETVKQGSMAKPREPDQRQ